MALSLTAIFAVLLPAAVGLNVTLMVQLPPPARVAGLMGQLSNSMKSPGFVPVTVMLEIVKGPVWLFMRTAGMELLGLATVWLTVPPLLKSRLLGDALASAMVGTTPAVPT